MLNEIAVVSVVTRPLSLSACDLCRRGVTEIRAAVAVQHSSGSAVSFAACDHCV